MRGWRPAEAERRAAIANSRVKEEAEQRFANVRQQADEFKKSLLARVMGTDSAEDQLQYGDGNRPEPEEDE